MTQKPIDANPCFLLTQSIFFSFLAVETSSQKQKGSEKLNIESNKLEVWENGAICTRFLNSNRELYCLQCDTDHECMKT